MTIVRSLGVTTLVALMSAHRAAAEHRGPGGCAFDQAMVQGIEDYLRGQTPCRDVSHAAAATQRSEPATATQPSQAATATPRSYN